MSKLRKTLGIDRVQIKRLFNFKDLQLWLDRLAVILEENYQLQRDVVLGSTAAETPKWTIREANAEDVTAGEARAVGNLIMEHKTNGTKYELEAS